MEEKGSNMIGSTMASMGIGSETGFRWRGTSAHRIEGFSDGVFGFAVTLLVVSLEVPKTFAQLSEAMKDFGAFACAFSLLVLVWFNQYRFFRRYGLQDAWTITLNAALLFVVLFFVYPLKFLFTTLIRYFTGRDFLVALPDGSHVAPLQPADWIPLMVIYGLGYVAIFGIFLLLHVHALRRATALELTSFERFDTRTAIRENALNVAVGTISVLLAGFAQLPGPAGYIYCLVGPLMMLHGRWSLRKRKSAVESAE